MLHFINSTTGDVQVAVGGSFSSYTTIKSYKTATWSKKKGKYTVHIKIGSSEKSYTLQQTADTCSWRIEGFGKYSVKDGTYR